MSSTAYLIDHPPARSQYLSPRREDPSGVVAVHTAENAPDFVAFDGGAEAVASWISRRSDAGSYHEIADSDSAVYLVPYTAEAFHDGTGTNRHSLGLSCATRAETARSSRWRRPRLGCIDGCSWCAGSGSRRAGSPPRRLELECPGSSRTPSSTRPGAPTRVPGSHGPGS
jgi:hypothetical protein